MFSYKDYMVDLVYEYVSGVKRVGQNKLNFRCPICGDGKKSTSHRGWFYIDTGSYYCWNAGCIANESGMSGLKFLSLVSGKPIEDIKSELISKAGELDQPKHSSTEVKDTLSAFFNDEVKPRRKSESQIQMKVKDGEWSETLPSIAKKYIIKRKLDRATFKPDWFNFYFDKKLNRIVIPWTDAYYQERTFLSSQKDEDKYKFPSGIEKPIFGLDCLDEAFPFIFICEGVFDSIWVKNGIAVGSLRLSNHQKELLKPYEDRFSLVWMPDNQQCDKSSYEKTEKTIKSNPYEKIFIWPEQLKKYKDVNETVIASDQMIDVWKNEDFLKNRIFNGLSAQMELMKSKFI